MGKRHEEFESKFTKKFVSGLESRRSDGNKEDKIAAIQAHKEEVQGNIKPIDKKLDFAAVLKAKAAQKGK